ncbi:MAG: hypothetical protein DRI95_04735 [Bacteroidetes bacterium]|nr:MAG: hypothetical protein DRI95_04735 [Bacteroidota bacterium]RLD85978.1 MAG: hypothetical protein DRJ07_01830 [Bacteroidota bacterium]
MINILRILISAVIGYWLSVELALDGFIRFLFFFGIFIAVSILIEIIRKIIVRIKLKNRKSKK